MLTKLLKKKSVDPAEHHKRRRLRFEQQAIEAHQERYAVREEFGQRRSRPTKTASRWKRS